MYSTIQEVMTFQRDALTIISKGLLALAIIRDRDIERPPVCVRGPPMSQQARLPSIRAWEPLAGHHAF